MRNPPLLAMIAELHWSAGIRLGRLHVPPGRSVPGKSLIDVSFGSIQATKIVSDVWVVSGRTLVTYTPGSPLGCGPIGDHSPSPAAGGLIGLAMRVGG